jgi:putative DNA primase/helicase
MHDRIGDTSPNLASAMEFIKDFLAGAEGPMWVCSVINPPEGATIADADTSKRRHRHVLTRDLERIEAFIKRRNEPGYGMYFCVSSMTPGERRKKQFAQQMPYAFADIDFKHTVENPEAILRILLALPCVPTRIHRSGNGYHVFWRLMVAAGPDQHARAERLLKTLAWVLGGDAVPTHTAALLRIAGSHNTKNGGWKEVVVVHETEAAYSLEALEQWVGSYTAPVIEKRDREDAGNPFLRIAGNQVHKPRVDVGKRLDEMHVKGGDVNGVHPTLLSITACMIRAGIDEGKIVRRLMRRLKELEGTDGWNWTREEIKIRNMCRDWQRKLSAEKGQARRPKSLSADVVNFNDATDERRNSDGNEDEDAPAYSDEALALRFTKKYPNLRYTAKWGQWSIFDGSRWKPDEKREVFSYARNICREAACEVNLKAIASAKTRAAVISMAQDDPRTAASVDQWDTDPWLLNTPAGTVDLRTGVMRKHQPSDYMTKITAVSPDPDCPTPLFDSFLKRATQSDEEYMSYLQRVLGYGLTGLTREEVMFFAYGTGGNGKGVLLGTVSNIMGDYHTVAVIETFMDSKTERHPTDLAKLRGARLVTATETEEGRTWAESQIKRLTGGDIITARFMRQDFFDYAPQFKLMIQGNNKPALKSVDEAIRRRFNLLPFSVTIPVEERDEHLKEKLKTEWPGILAWMVKGCVAWQERGLMPPEVVTRATAEYLEEQDNIGRWIEECCERDPNAFTKKSELFAAWEDWATANRLYRMNGTRFSQRLEFLGFAKANLPREGGRGHRGIKLLGAIQFMRQRATAGG